METRESLFTISSGVPVWLSSPHGRSGFSRDALGRMSERPEEHRG